MCIVLHCHGMAWPSNYMRGNQCCIMLKRSYSTSGVMHSAGLQHKVTCYEPVAYVIYACLCFVLMQGHDMEHGHRA